MGNPIKQLAGETAVYGLSTILARIINFLFVPFYTRLLTTESYGVVTEFMAYIAVLQVLLVLGLETGCKPVCRVFGRSCCCDRIEFGISCRYDCLCFSHSLRVGICRL